MSLVIAPYVGNLDPKADPAEVVRYEPVLKRCVEDIPTLGCLGVPGRSLYPHHPVDLIYCRTVDAPHTSDIEWKQPHKGALPWWVSPKASKAIREEIALLQVWRKDEKTNPFKIDIVASGWPGCPPLEFVSSVLDGERGISPSPPWIFQILEAVCGKCVCVIIAAAIAQQRCNLNANVC